MANYNTFVVVDCASRKSILATSSARKANAMLRVGTRIDVWNGNQKVETIYAAESKRESGGTMAPYIELEREYIRNKQKRAEQRNSLRRQKRGICCG